MRWLLALIIILLFVLYIMPEPDPVPVEKTFLREPVQALRGAQGVEADYLEAAERRKREMEEALEKQGGG